MAQYTAGTSDKKRNKALARWAIGVLGFLGFENFYVGKIKNGIIHCVIGLFLLGPIIIGLTSEDDKLPFVILAIGSWIVLCAPNLFRILLGKFRDNVGAPLREK